MAIYVYMRKRLTTQGLTTEDELGLPYWNLWQTRRFPWGELQPGDHVWLLDHWREEDRLSWELSVTEVDHRRVDSKSEAITHLAEMFGLTEEEIEDDAYLAGKADGRGVLLAWRGEQVRRLNVPRPPGLRIARHGWGKLDTADARRLLTDAASLVTPLTSDPDDDALTPSDGRARLNLAAAIGRTTTTHRVNAYRNLTADAVHAR
jgi:hypothetical protein